MNRITISILILLTLASIACLETTITAATDRKPTTTNPEPDSGAVYEIPAPQTATQCATVTAIQSLHLRAEPNEKARVVGYLFNGESVTILTNGALWWEISTQQGRGWSRAKYLQAGECSE